MGFFAAETHAPLMEVELEWNDVFDISVFPAVSAEEGLRIGAEAYGRLSRLQHPVPIPGPSQAAPAESSRPVSARVPPAQFNVTGRPAVRLPLHRSADGVPGGVQFVAGYGGEDLLARLAAQLEEAAPSGHRRPPVSG